MSELAEGTKAPKFSLPSTSGEDWSPGDAAGRIAVIYYYPRDNTSGCTKEGQDFAALSKEFRKIDAVVVGISPDSLASHEKFRAKFKFPFHLLSDTDKRVCTLYGVIREKSMYGRRFMGVERSTFLIDAKGTLRRAWRKVKVTGHAAEVLAAANAL
jgi:thioredoxin-dependent peroxiredoxin